MQTGTHRGSFDEENMLFDEENVLSLFPLNVLCVITFLFDLGVFTKE